MALQKQAVTIDFNLGLSLKEDPKQVKLGNFLALQNTVFDKGGSLTKRAGFPKITQLPDALQTTLTTLNDNLLATGSNIYAFSQDTNQWLNKGVVVPVNLETQPVVRVSTSQTSSDVAIASTGLACLVYVDNSLAYYQISDSSTGQQIVSRIALPATATDPRVFLLGRYFVITFKATVAASTHLQYMAIPTSNPTLVVTEQDISTSVGSLTVGYDGFVVNNSLYLSWEGLGNTVKTTYLTSTLSVGSAVSIAASNADLMSVTADIDNSIIWLMWWDTASQDAYFASYTYLLASDVTKTSLFTNVNIVTITSVATDGILTVFYENYNEYSFVPNTQSNFITETIVDSDGNILGSSVVLRSLGLASKAFLDSSTGLVYMLAAYGEINQPTYFLIDLVGNIYMRLAYSNGGGYAASQVLPSVTFLGNTYYTSYLIKDFLASVNKGTALPSGTPVNGIYTQTGINLAKFQINVSGQYSSEIAGALHLTGGQLWEYDGVRPVEHGFHVWPENIAVETNPAGGLITEQEYFYVFCYEWTDNQGNLHRSAPSIPISVTTTGATSVNTLHVPTLRLTYKIAPNPVRIVGYRWSVAQQTYYQFTSLASPAVNDDSIDSVDIVDGQADSAILGNVLLYTTGGILENTPAPSFVHTDLFDNRIFGINSEDRNSLVYSKQVIENVPVEFSDFLTLYVAPSTGSQGSTGPMTALAAMDDKEIIFKENAIYYITGQGPDNTGAQNGYSNAIFITSSVGCDNPNSIVLMPNGLMFQSNKGIWLLSRDLSTSYIGAAVEAYNSQTVLSAETIPGSNQVRFILDNNITLMYDYYQGQWGSFNNILAISACLYQGKHTYLNSAGGVYQELQNTYLDGSSPVLISFITSWISLAGLQGYERFTEALLLGNYYTPFKLNVSFAFDYNPAKIQSTLVEPDNYAANYGDEANWGSGGNWGGPGNIFEARVFPIKQKCETFQVIVEEVYDPSFGVAPGQGLSLSGLSLLVGVKKGTRTSKASQSFG